MKKKHSILTVIFILFLLTCTTRATAGTFKPTSPILPINKVTPGMKGKAYTVISGTKISSFNVSILGVLPRKTNPRNLILFKIEDSEINKNGGIAAGMSGSPIYVEGKLIGAIGYGWPFSDRSLGLATPIEEMISVLHWPERLPKFEVPPVIPTTPISADILELTEEKNRNINNQKTSRNILNVSNTALLDLVSANSNDEKTLTKISNMSEKERLDYFGEEELLPITAPILVDGMSPKIVKELEKKIGQTMFPIGSTIKSSLKTEKKYAPEPGAAIGAALAWGDIQVSSIGTLSAVDKEGNFIAFAHPMLNSGAVAYPLTEASIMKIIPSLNNTFKLGSVGDIVGIVTQDRPEAIAGKIGQFAPASSYILNFHDEDTGKITLKRFQTLADSFTGPTLGTSGIKALIENEWGRRGEGTAHIKYKFLGGNLKEGWERENIFFSPSDLVETATSELESLTKIFSLNQFQEIRPFGVEVDVSVTREPKVMFIEKLDVVGSKDVYEPGEKIEIDATLRTWRNQSKKKRISLTIPKDAAMLCEIVVRAGREKNNNDSKSNGLSSITNLSNLMKELDVVEKNNQIIAEINAPVANTRNETGSASKLPDNMTDSRLRHEIIQERMKEEALLKIETEYFVEGNLKKYIKISRVTVDRQEAKNIRESKEQES